MGLLRYGPPGPSLPAVCPAYGDATYSPVNLPCVTANETLRCEMPGFECPVCGGEAPERTVRVLNKRAPSRDRRGD